MKSTPDGSLGIHDKNSAMDQVPASKSDADARFMALRSAWNGHDLCRFNGS